MADTPIGEHGVIGDMQTLALVGHDATVEWLCWPRFDSPSVFGSLLDEDGGFWCLKPVEDETTSRQLYLSGTNVLITRFQRHDGVVEVEDFMTIGPRRSIVRRVTGIRGSVRMRSVCAPRPDYGRSAPTLETTTEGVRILGGEGDDDELVLTSPDGTRIEDDRVVSELTVDEGDQVVFTLGPATHDDPHRRDELFDETVAFWRDWIGRSTYRGRWREIVQRSALTLKLLTHEPSGALIAAGTTSLPEVVGGERNWDYRYVWIRDAAFTLYAFDRLGFGDESTAFASWLEDRIGETSSAEGSQPLAPLYTIDGDTDITETTLDHWDGYLDSRPVRIGNAAASQLQLDIYGEIVDSMYLADKRTMLPHEVWVDLRQLIDWVCENWDEPDEGMWEVRAERQHFTSSLLMCWVALERGVRMATFRGRPADLERWRDVRDEIYATIHDRAWNDELGAFTQTLDGDTLDASILLMPLVKFIAPSDPRWLSTLEAIGVGLAHDALVDRYDHEASSDGLDGDEGSFTICSFWYVEAMARSGRVSEARLLFDKLLTYAGPLGLFSEEIGPAGQQLGNFPQAFTHLALISAAVNLDEALDRAGRH